MKKECRVAFCRPTTRSSRIRICERAASSPTPRTRSWDLRSKSARPCGSRRRRWGSRAPDLCWASTRAKCCPSSAARERRSKNSARPESFANLEVESPGEVELARFQSGRHFLQIPGPTNVPDRVLRAIDRPTIDHRGPEFAQLGKEVLAGLRRVFRTTQPVVIYPASGTGAWEASLVNTLSPGDRVLMFETGHFAALWQEIAR